MKGKSMKMYQGVLCMFLSVLFLCGSSFAAQTKEKQNADKKKNADAAVTAKAGTSWRDTFEVDKANLASVGKNKYFILEPGYVLSYKKGADTLDITVTDKTKEVDGVKTRIVEERETAKGVLVEVSMNYFAIDKTTKAVYYFGEEVDMYKDGKVLNHEGSWLSGEKGAKFGLMMPGQPKVGDKYYQEVAPGVAMDRAEIESLTQAVTVPAGTFENCLVTKDGSALETATEKKQYAPEVGLVTDAGFELVKITKPAPKEATNAAPGENNTAQKTKSTGAKNKKKTTETPK